MKKIIFATLIVSLFLIVNACFGQSCNIEGQNCTGYWLDGGIWTTQRYGCPVDIHYEYQNCNGITYFRLVSISYYPTIECDVFASIVLPNGPGGNVNQIELWETWKQAFNEMIWIWFGTRHQQYPNEYICPAVFSYKTLTPGGCASWRYASKSVTPSLEINRFIPVPCEENGCCIHEVQVCWNQQLNQMVIEQETTTIISQGDCGQLQPLSNPFENYGPEWYIGPPQPCVESCYIW